MNCYFFALFCLTVAVSHVHSLDCCDEDFIKKYNLETRPSLLQRKKSLGKYKVDVVSVADEKRFTSVAGVMDNNGVNVSVVRTDKTTESRKYGFLRLGKNIYHQVGTDPKVDITLYNIGDLDGCLCEYGCIKQEDKNPTTNCAVHTASYYLQFLEIFRHRCGMPSSVKDGTTFYQCVVSSTNDVKESGTKCKAILENKYTDIKLKTL